MEEWKKHPDYPLYEFSNLGRARRKLLNGEYKILDGSRSSKQPYIQICVARNKRVYLHRMVCQLFNQNPHPGVYTHVLHNDNNIYNNCADNLRWGTQTINMQDRYNAGNYAKGMESHKAILTEQEVREIKKRLANYEWGLSMKLAEEYGVSYTCISWIKTGRSWKHIY